MQHGLGWHGGQLRKRVLHDTRLHIYPGGRADIRGRRVDPRVLITIEYLANATGSVRVSSLVSGHRLFTASGSVSAHVYGRAVDVTAIGGVRIKHHQGPGSVTERTVRLLLLLPQRMRPRQVVSLMDVDGPDGQPRLVRAARSQRPHPDRLLIHPSSPARAVCAGGVGCGSGGAPPGSAHLGPGPPWAGQTPSGRASRSGCVIV